MMMPVNSAQLSSPSPKALRQPAIELEHVTKHFGGRAVLDDVSIQVMHGEAFCLLGRSGTGKSVTLKIMIGLIRPEAGRVRIQGAEMPYGNTKRMEEIRKQIGFLFQSSALFDSISVAENVAFPLRRHTKKSEDEIRAIVRERLREVELENEGGKMPSELSGGMSKRAALARCLALDPSILLVDEPTTGLDRITATEIYDLLLRLKKTGRVSMVIVTHDVAGARTLADEFAVLDWGKIAARGSSVEDLIGSQNPLVRDLAEGVEG